MDGFFSAADARQRKPLPTLLARCGDCRLHLGNIQTPKMRVDGLGQKKILLVSDYPGSNEDRSGKPLVGGSGRWLERELRELDVDMRRDCWITNAQICHNPTKTPPKNVIDDCRPNLLRTIADLKPEKIILLGGGALESMVGPLWGDELGSVNRWTGYRIPNHKPNVWICPLNNPAYVLSSGDRVLENDFRTCLATAIELPGVPWPDGPPNYNTQIEPVLDVSRAAAWLDKITSGMVAVDYETTTLKPDGKFAGIVCCSVCWNGVETIAFPWHGPVIPALRALLENPDVGKIGWNAKFETRWSLARFGVEIRGWAWDGMLAAHAMDPRGGVASLKFQTFIRYGVGDYAAHITPFLSADPPGGNNPNTIHRVGMSAILNYCALDSLFEYMVSTAQMRELNYEFA